MTKRLLIVMALVEVGTGLALVAAPSLVTRLLLGEGLQSLQSLLLGRILGAALVSLGAACWYASRGATEGQRSVVGGLLIYNLAVPALLIHAAIVYGMHGIGLWPGSLFHLGLAAWSAICLREP